MGSATTSPLCWWGARDHVRVISHSCLTFFTTARRCGVVLLNASYALLRVLSCSVSSFLTLDWSVMSSSLMPALSWAFNTDAVTSASSVQSFLTAGGETLATDRNARAYDRYAAVVRFSPSELSVDFWSLTAVQ